MKVENWLVVEAEQDPLNALSNQFASMAAEHLKKLREELAIDISS